MIDIYHHLIGQKIHHPEGVATVIAVHTPNDLPAACWVLLDGEYRRYRGCDAEDAKSWLIREPFTEQPSNISAPADAENAPES